MPTLTPDDLALQRLYHWEKHEPHRIALTQPMGQGVVKDYTWGQVAEEVRRMAAHLQSHGWEPGTKVAILSKNCAWWMMADLAIWMAGYVSVPLYPTLAPETISHILRHSEAKACFIGKLDDWEMMKPGIPDGLPCYSFALSPQDARAAYPEWDAVCAAQAPMVASPVRDPDELATLIYTSGTTGTPKGVMQTFGAFAWALKSGLLRLKLGREDRMLSYLPLAHVVERMLVEHGWLVTGMHVFFAESLETFVSDIQRARPTVFFSVPRLWVKFQQGVLQKLPPKKLNLLLSIPLVNRLIQKKILKGLGLDQCRLAAGGAAHMPIPLLDWYRRIGLPINEGYGMTENLALSHITVPGVDMTGTVGTVYEGVEARIDPSTGELQMRSLAVTQGYFKEPALTREAFTEDGWLKTGDKAEVDAQGRYTITGRVKDMFKTSKGKYVAPSPIEDKLGMNRMVEACMVAGANLGQPIGLVMLNVEGVKLTQSAEGKTQLVGRFKHHLEQVNQGLDPHEQLSAIVLLTTPWSVENGLVTPTFKVKRNEVEKAFGQHFADWERSKDAVIFGD